MFVSGLITFMFLAIVYRMPIGAVLLYLIITPTIQAVRDEYLKYKRKKNHV